MNNLVLRRCGMNGWRNVAGTAALALLVVAGCGKREEPSLHAVTPVVSNVLTDVAAYANNLSGAANKTNAADAGAGHEDDTEEYAASLEKQQKVLAALDYARTPGAALETLSNMLASVSSKDIMAVAVPLQKNCDYHDEDTRAIMQVYEVVRARGQPGWAVLFCTLQTARFMMNSMTAERFEQGIAMLEHTRLSSEPDEMEKGTFASIHLRLLINLSHDPPRQIKQIERIEQMAKDNMVTFPPQPMENMVLQKASCYYWLGRDDEAQALIEGLYERYKAGTLSPLTGAVFEKGLEPCIEFYRSMAKANREIADKHAQGKAFWED